MAEDRAAHVWPGTVSGKKAKEKRRAALSGTPGHDAHEPPASAPTTAADTPARGDDIIYDSNVPRFDETTADSGTLRNSAIPAQPWQSKMLELLDPAKPLPIRRIVVLISALAVVSVFLMDNYYDRLSGWREVGWAMMKSLAMFLSFGFVFVIYRSIPAAERWWNYSAPWRAKYIPVIHGATTLLLVIGVAVAYLILLGYI